MTINLIQIFVASPSDTANERAVVEKIINELNNNGTCDRLGIRLESKTWEKSTYPSYGAYPQDVINQQIGDYDLFIGIMWAKFGYDTPNANSATEEEFNIAYDNLKNKGRCENIMFFFNGAAIEQDALDLEQYAKVKGFKQRIGGLVPSVYYCTYKNSTYFEEIFRNKLTLYLNNEMPEVTQVDHLGKSDSYKSCSLEISQNMSLALADIGIGVDYTISTVEKFGTSIKCLKEYIQHQYRRDDLYLKEVDFTFVQNFEFYLKTVRNCKHNSALKHLKNLKKVIKIALANEWMKRDPFIWMQFKYTETNTEFLTQEELTTLMSKDFGVDRLNLVRDVFSFCALTGLAYVDVSQLTPDHIVKDNNGALWIRKPRQKTGNMCNIPLLSPAVALIEKYATHPECIKRGIVIPVYSNQRQNAYLKEIATICGINKKLSTHVASHTANYHTLKINALPFSLR